MTSIEKVLVIKLGFDFEATDQDGALGRDLTCMKT